MFQKNIPIINVDFYSPEVIADPYPHYERIRSAGRIVLNEIFAPSFFAPGNRTWMVTGYDDANAILTDTVHFSNKSEMQIAFFGAPTMMFVDEPDHARLRRPVAHAFSSRTVAQLESRVAVIVDELLQSLTKSSRPFDLVNDFAQKIPMIVTTEMFGVSLERREEFAHWAEVAMTSQSQGGDAAFGAKRLAAHQALAAHFQEEITRHRREPSDDLMSQLLAAGDEEKMTDAEVLAACILLLAAGLETTGLGIALSLVILGQSADHRRQLVKDPSLVPAAFDEIMRCYGIAPLVPRVVKESIEIDGIEMAVGDSVSVLTAAANRDPARFDNPQFLDFTRKSNRHLGFSHGSHICLGAQLARLEANIALRGLLAAISEFTVTDVDFGPHFAVRGPRKAMLEPIRQRVH